jgi:hypothetical protein
MGSGQSLVVCSCEHGNEPLGSITGENLNNQVRDYLSVSQEGFCS